MAERVIKISMQAQVSNYIAGMKQVQAENSKAANTAENAKAKFEAQNQAMTGMGVGLLAVGTLAAAGVALAVKKYAEFDKAMSEVQASTHESASNMDLLRDAAIEAGAKTVFSATEAANAIDELAKAGLSTSDILGGALDGALSLASAGGLGVAEAASTAATALTLFKLKGEDIPHVADLLAAGAGKAQGSVDDLSQALNQGGLVASQAGFSIEETTGVLAAFASAGLKGSDAGTSLKTAIIALQKPSTQAQGLMDKYGISVYDANGKMLSFSGIAGQLQTKLGGLTDEQRNSTLATIFGTDAVRSAAVLYSNGAKGIDSWNKKVNDSGYAAETARIKLNNLNGDIEQLNGSFDTALIKSGSAANVVLRGIVQTATLAVNAFSDAPPVIQGTALALGALTAAATLTGGAFLVGVPMLAQFQTGLVTLKDSSMPGVAAGAAKVEGAVSKAGSALALTARAIPIIAAIGVAFQLANAYADTFRATSKELQATVTGGGSSLDLFSTQLKGTFGTDTSADLKLARDQIGKLNSSLKESGQASKIWGQGVSNGTELVLSTLKGVGKTLATTADSDLPSAQAAFRNLAKSTDGSRQRLHELLSEMPDYRDAIIAQARSNGDYSDSMSDSTKKTVLLKLAFGDAKPTAIAAAEAYLQVADAAADTSSQLFKLLDSINAVNGVNQDAESTNAAYQKSLQGVKDTIADIDPATGKARKGTEALSRSLDAGTAAGSANRAMLAGLAADNETAANAQYKVDLTTMSAKDATDKYLATLTAGHQAVYDQALALTGNADAAQKIADNVSHIPTLTEVKVILDAAQPNAELDALRVKFQNVGGLLMTLPALKALDTTPTNKSDLFRTKGNENGGMYNRSVKAFENGGFPSGIYPGRAGGIHKFAEQKLPWETYISPKPGHEAENIGYAMESLRRLGVKPQYAQQSFGSRSTQAAPAIAGPTINQTINPSVGMSEETIGRVAVNGLNFALRGN